MRSPQRAHHQRKKRDRQLTRALVTQGVIRTVGTTTIVDTKRLPRAELDAIFSHQSPEDRPFRSAKPTPWWHTWLPEKARRAREERQP